jgi:hypothetical protein
VSAKTSLKAEKKSACERATMAAAQRMSSGPTENKLVNTDIQAGDSVVIYCRKYKLRCKNRGVILTNGLTQRRKQARPLLKNKYTA